MGTPFIAGSTKQTHCNMKAELHPKQKNLLGLIKSMGTGKYEKASIFPDGDVYPSYGISVYGRQFLLGQVIKKIDVECCFRTVKDENLNKTMTDIEAAKKDIDAFYGLGHIAILRLETLFIVKKNEAVSVH